MTRSATADLTKIVTAVLNSEDLRKSISELIAEALAEKMNELLNPCWEQIENLKQELSETKQKMKEYHDTAEQYSRRNNLRIFGIEEKAHENTDEIVKNLAAEKLGIQLPEHAICRSHRVGEQKDDQHRPIIVKFVSYNVRNQLFQNKKKLKKTAITIREDLTKSRLQLYKAACKKFDYKNVWTSDGRVIAYDTATKKKQQITSLNEVELETDKESARQSTVEEQ